LIYPLPYDAGMGDNLPLPSLTGGKPAGRRGAAATLTLRRGRPPLDGQQAPADTGPDNHSPPRRIVAVALFSPIGTVGVDKTEMFALSTSLRCWSGWQRAAVADLTTGSRGSEPDNGPAP